MAKNSTVKRSAATGQFVSKPIGKGKATKFMKVEGMSLSNKSDKAISTFEGKGLRGDALRSAISKSFAKKQG